MKHKNFLVTGGMGFIGSNFIRHILRYPKIIVVNVDNLSHGSCVENLSDLESNGRYIFINKCIKSENFEEIFRKFDIDCLVHFAAESHVDRSIEGPDDFINTNIFGTFNLLNAALKFQKYKKNFHFHHVSTDEVFGSLTDKCEPFNEDNQYKPNSPYSASKAASDHLVRAWHKTYRLNTTTSNCSNNYGPYQFPEKLIPLIIFNALKGKKIPIYGNGANIRDWLYVEDHCDGILKIINNGDLGETYNIGGNNEKDNITIINKVCEILESIAPLSKPSPLTGKTLNIKTYFELKSFVEDRKGHDFRYSISSKKITEELNWYPQVDFENGMLKTIKWYVENINWLKDK
tara:strand:- start:606 stop:1643 length:1038 start_codon:yes stop_codon:yes gene_type:complete